MRRAAPILLAAVLGGCASAPPPAPAQAPSATAAPRVTPTPAPSQPDHSPPAPPVPSPAPGARPSSDLEPPRVRVLLVRSREAVDLPQPQRAWRVTAGGVERWLFGPLRLDVERDSVWQVGAYRDEPAASGVAYRLTASLGPDARVWRERAADGLVRVRVRWDDLAPADPRAVLAAAGHADALEVAGDAAVTVHGDGPPISSDGELVLEPADPWPMAVGDVRVRGRLRARVGIDGSLLVINDLNLESYLRGVVPVEMGPAVFPELEALKAQAVAARTYAVAHLGDHDDEGYDLCATPACQAYRGVAAEHPLSDRAVLESAGLVATYGDEPIDAMYSSTCGGHTEDAALLFPDRAQPYLVGVPCAWDRELALRGTAAAGGPAVGRTAFQATVAAAVLGTAAVSTPEEVAAAVGRRTGRAPAAAGDPATLAAGLLEACDLETAADRLTPHDEPLDQLLFLADLFEVDLDPPTADTAAWWPAAAALAALELRGDVTVDRGEAVPRPEGVGIFPRRAERSEPLPLAMPLWERFEGTYRSQPVVPVRPGTVLERYRAGDVVVALVAVRSDGDGEADRRSAWREWIREREWDQLGAALGMPDLERLRVTARGASGRVVGLEADGAGGATRSFEGFDVRRALDLPDTLFAMHVRTAPDGARYVRFLGRGWGHGVGMCQHGAYGLARSGRRFDAILKHYYTGIEVEPWTPQPPP